MFIMNKWRGFTLLEILVALLIFTILSMLLANALHTTMTAQEGIERNAQRLQQLQKTLLLMSRDIEQVIDRPIITATGAEQPAFIGTKNEMMFTYLGVANPISSQTQSALRRVRYVKNETTLWRILWTMPDQAAKSTSRSQRLQTNVINLRFSYLDKAGQFYDHWPVAELAEEPLPRAVNVSLTLEQWGEITQLYVISAQATPKAK
jgi:general secretion pathway protein J